MICLRCPNHTTVVRTRPPGLHLLWRTIVHARPLSRPPFDDFRRIVWNLPARPTSNTRGEFRMLKITRRSFVLGTVALSMDSMTRPLAAEPTSPTPVSPIVRPPGLGQSWHYARHDGITGKIIDVQVDRISALGQTINIESWSEAALANTPSW
jgi:hypothetical protein